MRALIWQWGRRGAGPLVAAAISRELAAIPGVETRLSLSTAAELLDLADAPQNHIPIRTYKDRRGFVARLLATPALIPKLARDIRAARIDAALCAMPAPLDFIMAQALRRAGVPYAVVVHDAQLHPGDAFPLQIPLQRSLFRRAGLLFALSDHVAGQLRARGLSPGQPLVRAALPPFVFGPAPPPAGAHGGRLRLLSFGRLLPYKGLDLLADSIEQLGSRREFELRVVGSGPEGPVLERLRGLANVTVENRWVPEPELGTLLGWADALILTHREASQSGVAAAALAARRWIVATRVGGLAEQLGGESMARLCAAEPGSVAWAIAALPRHSPANVADNAAGWRPTAEAVASALRSLADQARDPASRPQLVPASATPPTH